MVIQQCAPPVRRRPLPMDSAHCGAIMRMAAPLTLCMIVRAYRISDARPLPAGGRNQHILRPTPATSRPAPNILARNVGRQAADGGRDQAAAVRLPPGVRHQGKK